MKENPVDHVACDRAIQQLNDDIDRLNGKITYLKAERSRLEGERNHYKSLVKADLLSDIADRLTTGLLTQGASELAGTARLRDAAADLEEDRLIEALKLIAEDDELAEQNGAFGLSAYRRKRDQARVALGQEVGS